MWGKGLLIGMDLVKDKETKDPASDEAAMIVNDTFDNGLIIRNVGRYGNVLLLSSPNIVDQEQAEKALEILNHLIN